MSSRSASNWLALGSGFLVALALPPWGWWPLAFVGVASFARSLGDAQSRRTRFLRGWLFGAAWMFMGLGWMWYLTIPGYIFAGCLFATFHGLAELVIPSASRAGSPNSGSLDPVARAMARAALHTLAEALRLYFPFGGVPLATLAIGQSGGPLLPVVRVGGVIGLTWLVFQVGFLIGDREIRLRFPRAAFVVVAAWLIAAVAPQTHPIDAPVVRVALVQGGGRQGTSALEVPSIDVTNALLTATNTISPADKVDLVVWPENGVAVNGESFADSTAYAEIAAQAERLNVPISVGITEDSEFSNHPQGGHFVNAQIVIDPAGQIVSRYEKVRIVPFGEYVPFRSLLKTLGAPVDQIPGDAIAGRDPAVIEVGDDVAGAPLQVGVMISWEVFFGWRGRAAGHGEILVNPTNGSSYTGTVLQTQQIASSRLRAVENARTVMQVSPTGFTAFIAPDGTVSQRTKVSEQKVIIADIERRTGTTWYQRLGDIPVIMIVSLVAAVAVTRARTRARIQPRS